MFWLVRFWIQQKAVYGVKSDDKQSKDINSYPEQRYLLHYNLLWLQHERWRRPSFRSEAVESHHHHVQKRQHGCEDFDWKDTWKADRDASRCKEKRIHIQRMVHEWIQRSKNSEYHRCSYEGHCLSRPMGKGLRGEAFNKNENSTIKGI